MELSLGVQITRSNLTSLLVSHTVANQTYMQMQWLPFFPCAIVPLQPFVSTCKKIKIARVSYRLVNQRTKSLSDLLITKWLRTAVICSSFFPLATVRRCPCPCLLSTCGILSPGDNAAPRRSPSSRAHVAALC